MAEWKLFDKPRAHDEAFYRDIVLADHINQPTHAQRIYIAAGYAAWQVRFRGLLSVADFGAGNGGLLRVLGKLIDDSVPMWGYDLLPANVEDAHEKGTDVKYCNFLTGDVRWADLVIVTEVLEHLIDPAGFLKRVPTGTRVLATVPGGENAGHHYRDHLWAWDHRGFCDLFTRSGYEIERHVSVDCIHLVVGVKQ